jgi:hypothetical protein
MLVKNEKVYLIVLVISAIIMIFTVLYFTYNCPGCEEIYSKKHNKPVIVYRIG